MNQIERIKHMERQLDRASLAVMLLSNALEQYAEAQEALAQLSSYYGSKEWKADYAADEAGLLPQDLKRGILSEDAVWNVLTDNRELLEQLKALAAKA